MPKKSYDGKKIVISSQNFTVDEVENGDGSSFGMVVYATRRVELNKEIHQEQRDATLLHEVIHIIDEVAGGSLKEVQIDMITYGLIEAMKRNPWLKEIFE